MAHEVETMAYVGELPWHGLGTYVGDHEVTAKEMMVAAGLDWTVSKRPLWTPHSVNGLGMIQMPEHFGMVRDSDQVPLGVVGPQFTPLQNSEAFAFMDGIMGAGAHFHTAGSLRDGRRVWALVKMSGDMAIRRLDGADDVLERFLLLANGHDGWMALRVQFTGVRVVCMNTLSAALDERSKAGFTLRHCTGLPERVEAARESLGLAAKFYDELGRVGQRLAETRMDVAEFRVFAKDLLPAPAPMPLELPEEATARVRITAMDRKIEELENLFLHGTGNTGESRWDGLNAVTEWVDHKRAAGKKAAGEIVARSKRLDDAWFGDGARLKSTALRMLVR